jgi:hypothetical protein
VPEELIFSKDEEAEIRRISKEVVLGVLAEAAIGRVESASFSGNKDDYIYITKEFRGANKDLMEAEINEWLDLVKPLDEPKMVVEKDPLSAMALIKTITAKVRKGQTGTTSATPSEDN